MKIHQRNVATKQMKRHMKKKTKTKKRKDVITVPKEYKIWTENQMAQTTVGTARYQENMKRELTEGKKVEKKKNTKSFKNDGNIYTRNKKG